MQKTMQGEIIDVRFIEGQQWVALKNDRLYPGGGGQPPDKASIITSIGTFPIHETLLVEDRPFWKIDAPDPLPLEPVQICMDALWRWEISQQHTAQHILSGLAMQHYGWESTGFTIFDDFSKIELLTEENNAHAWSKLEQAVQVSIMQDLPVIIHEHGSTENLRKLLSCEDAIRVVEIEGVDRCGCGGTHVEKTSHVGGFSILHWERKNKASIRITFAAGIRLGKIAQQYTQWEHQLKKKLTGEVNDRVNDLLSQAQEHLKNEKKWIQQIASHIPPSTSWIVLRDLPSIMPSLRLLANTIQQNGGKVLLISDNGQFVLAGEGSNELFDLLKSHGAKGGGKSMINGTMDPQLADRIDTLIEKL